MGGQYLSDSARRAHVARSIQILIFPQRAFGLKVIPSEGGRSTAFQRRGRGDVKFADRKCLLGELDPYGLRRSAAINP